MENVYVVGVGMTPFGRLPDTDIKTMTRTAVDAALADAGVTAKDIGVAFFANASQGHMEGQHMLRGQIALRAMGVGSIPVFNIENACASGSAALNLAIAHVKSGETDLALAVGAEKMFSRDRDRMFAVFDSAWDVSRDKEIRDRLIELGKEIEPPTGTMSDKPYSVFMDVYAAFSRYHMARFGTTQRQIAAVSAKNHAHSVENPLSQYRVAYSVDEILAAPPIAYPLTLPMCSPVSDGAAAALVTDENGLKRLGIDRKRAIRVLASVVQTGSDRSPSEVDRHCTALAARRAYEKAGVGPRDISVAEVHDATAMGEILNAEALMLVPLGMAGPAAERGEFSLGGRIPINPSGGLESKGHPIGATGLGQIHELVTQLRGEAGARQVEGARIAAHENGGGLIGIEEAVVAVNLFSAN